MVELRTENGFGKLHETAVLGVLKNPDYLGDPQFREVVVSSILKAYGEVLIRTGLPQEDADKKIAETRISLDKTPGRIVDFANQYLKTLNSLRGQSNFSPTMGRTESLAEETFLDLDLETLVPLIVIKNEPKPSVELQPGVTETIDKP